nr:hypothetical protein [Tanacetum cinerariifolium]
MPNPKDITDPTTAMNMALALMAKAFKLNYSSPTNNNQRISSNPRNRQIVQPGMNIGQDRQMQMVGGNGGNQFRQYAGQNAWNLNGYNAVQNVGNQVDQNPRVQNIGNQNGLIGVQGNGNQNQIGNGNLVEAVLREMQLGKWKPDMVLQLQGSSAPVYDSDGSAKVHENYDDNEIFNMFTSEEQYAELIKPIPESHQVPQNDNDVISKDTSVEQEEQYTELIKPIPESHQVPQNDNDVISKDTSVEQGG